MKVLISAENRMNEMRLDGVTGMEVEEQLDDALLDSDGGEEGKRDRDLSAPGGGGAGGRPTDPLLQSLVGL